MTLSELGYADYDGKFFSLTPKILRIGHAWLSATPLPVLLQPHLDQLSERVGHSASASILDNTEIVYIARAAQKRVMSINLMPGSRLPAHCTSMGRVLLAALPPDEARARIERVDLTPRTPMSLSSAPEILAQIELARAQGYARIEQEVEPGLSSVAVPVLNAHGKTIAALNTGFATAATDPARIEAEILPALLRTQDRLRKVLA